MNNTSIPNYYVYIYLDPRKSGKYKYGSYEFEYEPYYIGKGKGCRYKEKKYRNQYFLNKFNRIKNSGYDPIIIKLKENLKEKESFLLEIKLIKLIGRKDLNNGPLINFTDGGEGISGYKHKDKTKELMSNKKIKNFNDIKKEFKKRGYILLTKEDEYKNNYQKLNYMCDKGHKNLVSWSNFKSKKYCKICNKKNIIKNFNDIKKEFKKINYILLTKENEYINSKQKLNYICDKGHNHSINWNNFKNGNRCSYCFHENNNKKQRKNFNDIKKEFKKRGYILLTKEDEYKNNYQKLEYIHLKCGKKHSVTWGNFQQGRSCPYCSKNKIDFSEIKKSFELKGYKLLTKEEEYKNAHQKLNYICDKGHSHLINWNNFKNGNTKICN